MDSLIYKSLKEWLNGYKTGEEAYKQKGYPKDTDGNIIKKVKLQEEFSNKGHKVGTSIAEKGNIYKILMFKGGTSLSKVFNLIGRFSEDIDLILDWRLVSNENPLNDQESKNKQVRFNEQINENAKEYIQNELLPIISQIQGQILCMNIYINASKMTFYREISSLGKNYHPSALLQKIWV